MKLSPTLLLTGTMLGITLLFSRCRNEEEYDPLIPYDVEKAQEHIIPIDDAIKLTSIFRKSRAILGRQLKDTAYLDKNFNMPLAEEFNRDAIAALLNQEGAKGVRIYLGQDTKGLIRMVLVAVDKKGNDITGRNGKIMKYTDNSEAVVLEAGQRCPTLCSTSSPLD